MVDLRSGAEQANQSSSGPFGGYGPRGVGAEHPSARSLSEQGADVEAADHGTIQQSNVSNRAVVRSADESDIVEGWSIQRQMVDRVTQPNEVSGQMGDDGGSPRVTGAPIGSIEILRDGEVARRRPSGAGKRRQLIHTVNQRVGHTVHVQSGILTRQGDPRASGRQDMVIAAVVQGEVSGCAGGRDGLIDIDVIDGLERQFRIGRPGYRVVDVKVARRGPRGGGDGYVAGGERPPQCCPGDVAAARSNCEVAGLDEPRSRLPARRSRRDDGGIVDTDVVATGLDGPAVAGGSRRVNRSADLG